MIDDGSEAAFEAARPRLVGLAYRMLGTRDEADDIVQEAWIRWHDADRTAIAEPAAWLTTVTTRIAVDRLRSAQHRREEYVGPWLPEPVVTGVGPEDAAVLADSLTLGFLTLLDRLSAEERAVVLLADVFSVPFAEIAATVGKTDVACRQIASRARRRLQGHHRRESTGAERAVVEELLVAFAMGDIDAVLARLAPGAVCVSDGGPNRRAARRPVVGADRVARFFLNLARRFAESATFAPATVNGDPGLVVSRDGEVDLVAAFEVVDGRVHAIWLIRNPDKLEHLAVPLDAV